MELIAIIVGALLGWNRGTLGVQEAKAIAIVVLGWTTVTTLASIPDVSVESIVLALVIRTLSIAVPYALGAMAKQLSRR